MSSGATSTRLNADQKAASEVLAGTDNVFLTGAAGSGKSHLLRQFLRDKDPKAFPCLSSTGSSAILVGGRTFHSFFGLGILEGGVEATIERAVRNKRLVKRIKEADGVVIDEVSMLSGATFRAAETIARKARGNTRPWGGLRVIAVGDYCQLPPVNPFGTTKDWAFLDHSWLASEFAPAILREIMRTSDQKMLKVLNRVRYAFVDDDVRQYLNSRCRGVPADFEGTRLFARKEQVERHNLERLGQLPGRLTTYPTSYRGKDKQVEDFKRHAPIPESIALRPGALVMMRQNDPKMRWVNGSLGHVSDLGANALGVRLLTGREIIVEPVDFTLLDAEGNPVVTASNFPVTLAYALTIHKAQGATLDRLTVDLRGLWESGQAYVALSRARSTEGLYVEGWDERSIRLDPAVHAFHCRLVGRSS